MCLCVQNGILNAEGFREQLTPGVSLTYQHWNLKRKEITGFSNMQYLLAGQGEKKQLVEINENTKPDGKAFSRKTLWFDPDTGILARYEEEDFRNNLRIVNTYSGNTVRTRLIKEQKSREFRVDFATGDTVPFEVILLYLRKHFSSIMNAERYTFSLYLPVLAIELEEKGLPLSMSRITMEARPEGETFIKSPRGRFRAMRVDVFPESWALRTLLPREKSHFRFFIDLEPPYHILQFEEGETRHTLIRLTFPPS